MVNITPAIRLILFIFYQGGEKMGYVLAKDDEISLLRPEWHEGEEEYFEIILNETLETVGYIKYYYWIDPTAGNISYKIYEEYRGKNYAKKALKILARNISGLDDEDLYISILPNNIASIKTAVGAGATFYQVVEIPKSYIISEQGKYKYANMYIIKNTREKEGTVK